MSKIGWTRMERCPLCKSKEQHTYSMYVYKDEDSKIAGQYVETDEEGLIVLRAVLCRCGLVYTDRYLNDLERYYRDVYQPILQEKINRSEKETGEQVILGDEERRAIRISLQLADGDGRQVLDVGCGSGKLLMKMKDKGWDIYGLDPRDQEFPTWHTLEEVGDAKFDLITMSHVLEHVPNPVEWLESFRSKLKKDGQIFVEVPSLAPGEGVININHITAFSVHTIQDVLMKAGYGLLSVGQVPVVEENGEKYKVVLQASARVF